VLDKVVEWRKLCKREIIQFEDEEITFHRRLKSVHEAAEMVGMTTTQIANHDFYFRQAKELHYDFYSNRTECIESMRRYIRNYRHYGRKRGKKIFSSHRVKPLPRP
jgi:hypothetical protein